MGNDKISDSFGRSRAERAVQERDDDESVATSMGEVAAEGAEDYWTWRIGLQELARDEEREISERCEAAATLVDEARGSLSMHEYDERREALDKARADDVHPALVPGLLEFVVAGLGGGAEFEARGELASRPAPPMEAPLPIFEVATSTLFRSDDGGLEVLPMQYGHGKPTFEVRHDGEPVLCTHDRVLADAYVAGYDLAAAAAKELLASLKPKRSLSCGHETFVVNCPACLAASECGVIPLGEVESALAAHLRSGAALDAPPVPSPDCTGYVDEAGHLAHDGDTCPVHEGGLDIGDGDPGDAPDERALPFVVIVQRTGDRAEAATAEAILIAAATLVDDARSGIHGDVRALRDSIYVTENGTYAGVLTAFARQGVRSI